jgi:chromosome segregation ATPase
VLNETIANHRSETEILKRAVQLYEQRFAEQQRRFEEESRKYQTQLQNLQEQMKESQRNYEKLCDDHATSLQEFKLLKTEIDSLKSSTKDY